MTTNNDAQKNNMYSFDLQKFIELPPIDYKSYEAENSVLKEISASDFSYNLDQGNFVYKGIKNIVDVFNKKSKLEKAISFFNEDNTKKLDRIKQVNNNTSNLSLQYLDFFKDAYLDCNIKINQVSDKIFDVQREYEGLEPYEPSQKNTPLDVLKDTSEKGTQLARDEFVEKRYGKDMKKNKNVRKVLENRREMLQEKYSEMIDLLIEPESRDDKIDISKELFTSYLLKNKSKF